MTRRLVSIMGRVKGGPTRGGSTREFRIYDDEALTTLSTLYQRATGVGTQPNPMKPNAGKQVFLTSAAAAIDAFIIVTDVAAFQVGDIIPIYDATNTVYRVITIITPATKRLDLDSALGFAFATATAKVNNPDMEGHIWFYVDDIRDYFAQVTETSSGRKLPPLQFPIRQPAAPVEVAEEGTLIGTRPRINFVGSIFTATDDAGNGRVNVTENLATTTTSGSLHQDDKKRLTVQALGDKTGSFTIDLALGHIVRFRATGNVSITLSNPLTDSDVIIECEQDGTGSRTITWVTTIKWKDAATPVATTTAGKKDIFLLHRDSADYLGVATLNF